ncbi:type II toxin-antitoxin system HigB family toxin [Paraglaciecola mesophila]
MIHIGGNNLRLFAFTEFRHHRMFVKHIAIRIIYNACY